MIPFFLCPAQIPLPTRKSVLVTFCVTANHDPQAQCPISSTHKATQQHPRPTRSHSSSMPSYASASVVHTCTLALQLSMGSNGFFAYDPGLLKGRWHFSVFILMQCDLDDEWDGPDLGIDLCLCALRMM